MFKIFSLIFFLISILSNCNSSTNKSNVAPHTAQDVPAVTHQSISFTLDPSDGCISTPNPNLVPGAKYFYIECSTSVKRVRVEFMPFEEQGIYGINGKIIKNLSVVLSSNLEVHRIEVCNETGRAKAFCSKIQFSFRTKNDSVPLLDNKSGLVFSEVASPLLKEFNPKVFVYNVTLKSMEPVIITARSGRRDWFVEIGKLQAIGGFTEGVKSIEYRPDRKIAKHQELIIYVSDIERKLVTTYTIGVDVIESHDTSLESVEIATGQLSPAFTKDVFAYTCNIPENADKLQLNIKATDNEDTRCFAQFSTVFMDSEVILWLKKKPEEKIKMPTGAKQLIPITSSGNVAIPIPKNTPSANVVVYCSKVLAPEQSTRYIFTVIKSKTSSEPSSSNVKVSGFALDQPVLPGFSGPYVLREISPGNANFENKTGTRHTWINFKNLVPKDALGLEIKYVIDGEPMNEKEFVSKHYYVPKGERRTFRIEIYKGLIHEEYVLIIDRTTKWHLDTRVSRKFGYYLSWFSTMASLIDSSLFLSNAKFLQFLAVTHWFQNVPETFKSFTEPLLALNFQQTSLKPNEGVSAGIFMNGETASNKTASLSKSGSQNLSRKLLEKKSSEQSAPKLKSSKFSKTLTGMDDNSKVIDYLIEQKKQTAACCHSLICLMLVFSIAAAVYTVNFQQYVAQKVSDDSQKTITSSNTKLQSVVPFYIPFIFETIKPTYYSILHPSRFWNCLYDFSFISMLHSCFCILCSNKEVSRVPVHIFGLIWVKPVYLAFFAIIMLAIGPGLYFTVGTLLLRHLSSQLVFSTIFNRYHDKSVQTVKAIFQKWRWVPILSNLTAIEIVPVASSEACTYSALHYWTEEGSQEVFAGDAPVFGPETSIHFTEDHLNYTPWFVGNPNKLIELASKSETLNSTSETASLHQYHVLKPLHQSQNIKAFLSQDTDGHAYCAETNEMQMNLTSDNVNLNSSYVKQYADATVGSAHCSILNAYDIPLKLKLSVCLNDIPAICSLRCYPLWINYKNLQKDYTDCWSQLFNSSHKGYIFQWILEHVAIAQMIFAFAVVKDPTGLLAVGLWLSASLLLLAVSFPPVSASATSKWSAHMKELYSQQNREQSEKAKQTALTNNSWPFNDPRVQELFKLITEHQTVNHVITRLWDKLIVESWSYLVHHELWSTRFRFFLTELLVSQYAEFGKVTILMLLFLSNSKITNESSILNKISSFLLIVLPAVFLFCIHSVTFSYWKEQIMSFYRIVSMCFHITAIVVWDLINDTKFRNEKLNYYQMFLLSKSSQISKLLLSKIEHLFSLANIKLTLDKKSCDETTDTIASPLLFTGEKVFHFKVNEVTLLNNELGIQLKGISEPKKHQWLKMRASGTLERCGIYKQLHMFAPLLLDKRYDICYRSMPLQMSYSQFLRSSSTSTSIEKEQRCVGTLQIINSFSGTQQGSIENDSFISLYTAKKLIPELGKIYLKEKGHGYVVQWIASTKSITIRGPEIRAGSDYSVTSLVSSDNNLSLKTEYIERTVEKKGKCIFAGKLQLNLLPGERPNLNKPVQVFNSQEMIYFSINPDTTKIDYYEYEVGNCMRYKLTLRSKQFRASPHLYSVEWTSAADQKPIDANVKSITNGTLVINWNSNEKPDMVTPILLKEKAKKKHSLSPKHLSTSSLSIVIDPLETDAHQMYFNPVLDQQNKKLFGLFIPALQNSISGLEIYQTNHLPLVPVPCTIVQCVHPNEKQFRVEPNFNEVVLSLSAQIEEYQAVLQYELNKSNTYDQIMNTWPRLMSINEFLKFWAEKQYNLTKDNTWIDSQLLQSKLSHDGKTEYLELFRQKLEERVESYITYLSFLKTQFRLWAFAYSDSDMYAALLHRDSGEWLPYRYGGVNVPSVSSPNQAQSDSSPQSLSEFKALYRAKTPQFQYPMTVSQKQLSLRSNTSAQCEVWREELVAWLSFTQDINVTDSYCDNHNILKCSNKPNKGDSTENCKLTPTEIIIEDLIRALEKASHCIEIPSQQIYSPMVHYVVISTLFKSREQLEVFSSSVWNPLPLAAHPCKVRLFKGDVEDGQYVNWKQPVWVNCFIKLTSDKVILLFPHENDATLDPPSNFSENDPNKRFAWNQIQAYYIPLKCFDRLSVSKVRSDDLRQPEELAQLLSKLVLQKSTQNDVDDDYIRTIYGNGYSDDVIYQGNVLKLRLCNSIPSSNRKLYSYEDSVHLGAESHVMPLTLRFYDKFQERWEKAITEAKLHTPDEPDPSFDGVLPSEVREEARSARRLARRYSDLAIRCKLSKDQNKEMLKAVESSDYLCGSVERSLLARYADQKFLPYDPFMDMTKQQSEIEPLSQVIAPENAYKDLDDQLSRAESRDSQRTYSTESSVYVDVVALQRDAMSGTLSSVLKTAVLNSQNTTSGSAYAARFEGDLENMLFKGGHGTLYDKETQEVVYSGEWLNGCRWGKGECRFKDTEDLKWHYEGEFIADELRKGKLTLVNHEDLKKNLLASKQDPSMNRYRFVEYEGLFFLPETAVNQTSPAPKRKVSISHEKEQSAYTHPRYLKALLQSVTNGTVNVEDVIIDIPRSISASADHATLKASLHLAHQLMHKEKLDERGVTEMLQGQPAAVSQLIQDTHLALEQYLPHCSKWTSLLAPGTSGFETIQDRFAAGRAMFADGSCYYGELRNGNPEGLGLLYCSNTEILFHGYFQEGVPNGYGMGSLGAANCDASVASAVYYGEYRYGLRDGPGIQLAENRSVQIRGVYKEDKLNGEDCYIHVADPSCLTHDFQRGYKKYTGGIVDNLFDGVGMLEYRDGHVFRGKFANGERVEGQMFDPSGKLIYAGEWLNDLPHGRATAFCSSNGYLYCGEVNHGSPEGVGELFYKGEIVYEGIWLNGKPHGRGTLYAADGVYEGEFVQGMRSGKGRFEFKKDTPTTTPKFYEGNWKNDAPHGYGVYSDETRTAYPITYENGELTFKSIKFLKQNKYKNNAPARFEKQFVLSENKISSDLFYQEILNEKLDVEVQVAVNSLGEGLWHKYTHKDLTYIEKAIAMRNRKPFDNYVDSCDLEKIPKFTLHADELTETMPSAISPEKTEMLSNERIEIHVENAENLIPTSSTRPLHPYCRVRLGHRMKRTKPINAGGVNPKWNNVLSFAKELGWVQFEVYDKQPLGADYFVGSGEFNLTEFLATKESSIKACIALSKRGANGNVIDAGKLFATIRVVFESFDDLTPGEQRIPGQPSTRRTKKDSFHSCTVRIQSLVLNNLSEKSEVYFVLHLEDHVNTTEPFNYVQPIPMPLNITRVLPFFQQKTSICVRIEVWLKQASGDEVLGFQLIEFKDLFSDTITLMKFSDEAKRDLPVGTTKLVVSVD